MPKHELDRAVRLFNGIKTKDKETELLAIDLRQVIVKLSNDEFIEYMKRTTFGKIIVEEAAEECKREE